MFSLIYAVLLHPFPYAGADRIMNPVMIDPQYPDEYSYFGLSKAQLDEVRLAGPVDSVPGFDGSHMEITGGGLPEDIYGAYLTENAGTFFGVRALLGRNIEPSDAKNGGHSVVVLNYRFWQRHFGGDPHIIGQTLEIDHACARVTSGQRADPDGLNVKSRVLVGLSASEKFRADEAACSPYTKCYA
jgi:MacB-like periplasmic core domain